MLNALEKSIAKAVDVVGWLTSILLLLMVLNVSFDVLMRYVFHNSSVGMQEMEWHLFAVVILFGVSVALKDEGHVRVDFLYDQFSPKTKAIVLNPMWFAILIAMNLQTSFLTPPFGFSLFYLKGVCPPEVRTVDIYRGVIPFICIQIMVLASIVLFPGMYGL